MIGETETGCSSKSGLGRLVSSLLHGVEKAIKRVFLFQTNLLGIHGATLGSRSRERQRGMKIESLWLPC